MKIKFPSKCLKRKGAVIVLFLSFVIISMITVYVAFNRKEPGEMEIGLSASNGGTLGGTPDLREEDNNGDINQASSDTSLGGTVGSDSSNDVSDDMSSDINGDVNSNIFNGNNLYDWISYENDPSNGENINTSDYLYNATKRFDLTGGWKLARVPDIRENGEELSDSSYNAGKDGWIDAIVPGTALTSYEKAGIIPDPYYGRNMLDISQKEYNVDYWYRNTFTFPSEFQGKKLWINFDGINWKADVYINGSKIGRIEGPFTRGKFDITSYVRYDSVNYIAVKIIWCQAKEEDTPTFICVNSWDFMPAIPGRNVGIYKDVYLSTSEDVMIVDPFINTDLPLPNTDYADVSLSLNLKNNSDKKIAGKIKGVITPGDISFEENVIVDAQTEIIKNFSSSEFSELRIDNPKLWWPNGMGDPNLYTLRLTYEVDGVISDIKTISFGIREYSYDTPEGSDLQLSVNGCPVLIRGGNWGIPDAMLKWTKKEFDTAVRLNKEMNFNMIRTWHGTSDFDEFYDACDKYGIMVFEDFWLNGSFYPKEPKMFYANAIDKFKRLRNRACLALWCGENEAVPPRNLSKFLADTYEELDGTRLYIQSSNLYPVSGGISYGIEDPSWYFKVSKGLVTEVGGVTVPVIESLRKMMPENKLWPIGNDVWDLHDFDFDIGNKQIDRYKASINSRYGFAKNIEDFCEKAQLINLETHKAIFEGFNDKMWNGTTGVLLWMSQSAWPSTIWQTYDYYFEPTGAYYGSKLACEPVHVQWNSYTGNVKVVNNSSGNYNNATVEAKVYNLDGTLKFDNTQTVNITGNTAVSCFDLFDAIGDNIAAGKSVTASSYSDVHTPDNVTDTDTKSRWAAGSQGDEWITIDLGEIHDIDNVIITWEAAYAKNFNLQVSTDNSNWVDVYTKVNGAGGIDNIKFPSMKGRFVRINCTSPGTMWAYSIYDIIVNSTGTTSNGPRDLTKVHFIKLTLKDENGNMISENTYWRSTEGTDYSDMDKIPEVNLEVSAKNEIVDDGMRMVVEVKNTTNTPAIGIRLKAIDKVSGENILPAFYSDNYFTLLPDENKTVTIDFSVDGIQPALIVEGYNIVDKEVEFE